MPEVLTTILLVDDHADTLDLLVTALPAVKNYRLLTAHSGGAALEHFVTERIDCIILDLLMPGMDGFTLLRTLRTDPVTAPIPVVITTAAVPLDDARLDGLVRPTDHILEKPTTLTAIITAIEQALAPTSATAPMSS